MGADLSTELWTLLSVIAGFMAVKLFDMIFDKSKRHDERLQENTIAITALQVEIKHLNEKLSEFHRLKHDVDQAHHSIREMKKRVEAPSEIR